MHIEYNRGHYDVVTEDGKILCCCDSHKEATEEMEEMENEIRV